MPVNIAGRCCGRFPVVGPKQQPAASRQVEGIDSSAVSAVFMRVSGDKFRHICGGALMTAFPTIWQWIVFEKIQYIGVHRPAGVMLFVSSQVPINSAKNIGALLVG